MRWVLPCLLCFIQPLVEQASVGNLGLLLPTRHGCDENHFAVEVVAVHGVRVVSVVHMEKQNGMTRVVMMIAMHQTSNPSSMADCGMKSFPNSQCKGRKESLGVREVMKSCDVALKQFSLAVAEIDLL